MSTIYRGTDFRSDNMSNAEYDLFIELQRRQLTRHMITQVPWKFNLQTDDVDGTWIDFYWSHPYRLAVYLDGTRVHRSIYRTRKDRAVTTALSTRGITVFRFPYTAPLTKTMCHHIVDQIETALKERGYE